MVETLVAALVPAEIQNVWLFLLAGGVSAVLLSLAKGGFGGSIGLLSVPIMIYACADSTQLALGVTLPLLIACDYVAVINWWGQWNPRPVVLMLPGAVAGVAAGGATLWAVRLAGGSAGSPGVAADRADAAVMLAIGAIAVGFVALQAFRALRARPLVLRPGWWQGTAIGAAAGYTSTLAHAGGPLVNVYMLPQQMPKGTYVATTVLYYWIGNQIKLVPYFLLGLINTQSASASLLLMPAVVAGTLLGIFLHHRVEQKQFTGIVHVLLALAGVHLMVKAVGKLWA